MQQSHSLFAIAKLLVYILDVKLASEGKDSRKRPDDGDGTW